MSIYNTQLQENNSSLNSVLSKVNNLPDKGEKGLVIEKWDFTLEDGSVISKYVEHPKAYNITYSAPYGGVDFSNTQKTILHGQDYSVTISAQSGYGISDLGIEYIYEDYTILEWVFELDWLSSYDLIIQDVPCDIKIRVYAEED